MNNIVERIRSEILDDISRSNTWNEEYLIEIIDEKLLDVKEYIPINTKRQLKKELYNSLCRFDILSDLLEDENITEIMINGYKEIFIEKNGAIERYQQCFASKSKLEDIVQQIVSGHNRVVNESTPVADVRLDDGSRVNVVLPPVAINGPIVTIRKFPKQDFTLDKFIETQSITKEAAEFLKMLVRAKYNIFISGGTGSGKTTLLNALSEHIPSDERIITIEDSAELKLQGVGNLVRLEARTANVEGKNEVSIRELIRSSLRMRPDRIIVGEVRGEEVLDMLQAMQTGHDGSISTGHANSSTDMISRLETLVIMAKDFPLQAVKRQIGSALDILIHLGRMRDKSRRVLEINEVLYKNGDIELNKLYEFSGDPCSSNIGELVRTNNDMVKIGKMIRAGINGGVLHSIY